MIQVLIILLSAVISSAVIKEGYPYGNPWFYQGIDDHTHNNRSNRTKEEADALWSHTIKQPFNLETHTAILDDYRRCRMYSSNKTSSSIINLAIGRTGSGTLKQALIMNNLPGHHTTQCTALDAQKAGYHAVVLTIRDPAARILSGFQRREEMASHSKVENVAFNKEFMSRKKGINNYIDALRDPNHHQHQIALELTYGGGRQSYMIPLAQYYGLTNPELKIRVYFLCTPNLSDDFENLGKYLGWPKPSAARDFYLSQKHRRLGTISSTKSEVAAEVLSPENDRWIHEVLYKADSELNIRYCGEHRKNISYHDGYSLV
jgi:hypothetical protein